MSVSASLACSQSYCNGLNSMNEFAKENEKLMNKAQTNEKENEMKRMK